MKIDEIQHKIAVHKMNASQVFTQMLQHIPAKAALQRIEELESTLCELEKANSEKCGF